VSKRKEGVLFTTGILLIFVSDNVFI